MATGIATWWDSVPAFFRDFVEGAASQAIAAAAGAVYGLDLANPALTPKVVIYAAVSAAVGAVIAFARHRLAPQP